MSIIPKEFVIEDVLEPDDDTRHTVFLDGEVVFQWHESMQQAPEDLTFHRAIGEVFADGVEAGLKLARKRIGGLLPPSGT